MDQPRIIPADLEGVLESLKKLNQIKLLKNKNKREASSQSSKDNTTIFLNAIDFFLTSFLNY